MGGVEIEQLYVAHRDALLAFFARRTADGEVALDLMAETFAQAFVRRRSFRGATREEATGWLYGIARRQLAGYQRRGYARDRALARLRLERPERDAEIVAEVERRAALDELGAALADALHSLSDALRDAVRLRVVDGLPYARVAEELGVAEPAARARVSRGLSALADVLDHEQIKELRR